MADIQLQLSASLDGIKKSVDQVHDGLRDQTQFWQDYYRGIKWFRLPLSLQAQITGGAVNIGESGTTPVIVGPEEGYAWSIMRLAVDGLAGGATPDVVQIFRSANTAASPPLWTFSGNTQGGLPGPQSLFPRLGLVMMGGDTINLVNSGALAATGRVRLSGELIQVPAEMLAKLA